MKTPANIIKEEVLKGGFTSDDLKDIARLSSFIEDIAIKYANQCKHRYTSVSTNKCLECGEIVDIKPLTD